MAIEAFTRHVLTGLAGMLERQGVFAPGRAKGPEEILETALRKVGYQKGRTTFRDNALWNGWANIPFRNELTELTYEMISDRVDSHRDALEPELSEDNGRGFKATVYAFCYSPEYSDMSDEVTARDMLLMDMKLSVPFGANPALRLEDEHIRRTIDTMMRAGYLEIYSRRGRNYLHLSPQVDQVLAAE